LVELAQRRAETDELTGLVNRSGLLQAFGKMDPSRWALAALDLDHFKQVNDQLGHAAGDAVLIGFAEVLRQCTRNNDVLARVGGDEFVILLPGADLEAAREVCERLRVALHRRQAWPAPLTEPLEVTVSMGLVTSSAPGLQTALAAADKALYEAKRQGRNRVGLADPQDTATE
jgi:diguanylate cyclase (GGDEF)-like protein